MKMENRNQYNSPRDRIDESLLIRLLSEEEPMQDCSCAGERHRNNPCGRQQTNRSSGCENDRSRQMPSCGCGDTRQSQENGGNGCGCGPGIPNAPCSRNKLPGFPLAMVYMPDQEWEELFDEEEAIIHGTLFRGLVFPFYPGKCDNNCGCR